MFALLLYVSSVAFFLDLTLLYFGQVRYGRQDLPDEDGV